MSFEKVEIGNATLYLGDCLEVVRTLDRVTHVFTDPPYEAGAHTSSRLVAQAGGGVKVEAHRFEAMDDATREEITKFVALNTDKWSLVFCQNEGAHFWREAFREHGIKPYSTMVWCKPDGKPNFNGTGPGVGYESIVATWHGEGRSSWNGGGKTGIFIVNQREDKDEFNTHTTVKPQKLMVELVSFFSDKDDLILDCFMGSGSTGVAAVGTGRKFIGIERDPEYFEICCRRVEAAQKGMFHAPYVKTKARVTVGLLDNIKAAKPEPKEPAQKMSAPKPRGKVPATPKKKFSLPTIDGEDEPEAPRMAKKGIEPLFKAEMDKYGSDLIPFDNWTPEDSAVPRVVGADIEVAHNFFFVGMKRFSDGKRFAFEMSDRSSIDYAKLGSILRTQCIITFNGMTYDVPLMRLAMNGYDTYELKAASDRIIRTGMKPWQVEKEFNLPPEPINHVDLMEPNPSVRQGLKTLIGRLHGRHIMDLPFDPDARLSRRDMNMATLYCMNVDVEGVQLLFNALKEPLQLRVALGKQYGLDLRSKSDAQVGEAIVKKRVKAIVGRINRVDNTLDSFTYTVPDFFTFRNPEILKAVEVIRNAKFRVDGAGKVQMPRELEGLQIRIGSSTYTMGMGGLHSTEKNRAIRSDGRNVLIDLDVASQYPRIILKLGMFPKALGKAFLKVYEALVDERVEAKHLAKIIKEERLPAALGDEVEKLKREMLEATVKAEGGKIAANGVFGKLLSLYSDLYAPDLGIATTLTGQLTLLMIIDMCEHAGIPVMSGNTDGVVLSCPRELVELDKNDIIGGKLREVLDAWESATGFGFESTVYKAMYNSSVNTYIAIKEDGGHKRKGPIANPWDDNDRRGQLMKNPQMTLCSEAILKYIKDGTSIEDTVRACRDPRQLVTIQKVTGGAKWRDCPLGRVVRYYWSTDGDPIIYSNGKRKVGKTDGAKPLMELTEAMPDDVDYDRYIAEAKELAADMGVISRGELL